MDLKKYLRPDRIRSIEIEVNQKKMSNFANLFCIAPIFDEVSKLAEFIVTEGNLSKIDRMYQIRFINFEGESW